MSGGDDANKDSATLRFQAAIATCFWVPVESFFQVKVVLTGVVQAESCLSFDAGLWIAIISCH